MGKNRKSKKPSGGEAVIPGNVLIEQVEKAKLESEHIENVLKEELRKTKVLEEELASKNEDKDDIDSYLKIRAKGNEDQLFQRRERVSQKEHALEKYIAGKQKVLAREVKEYNKKQEKIKVDNYLLGEKLDELSELSKECDELKESTDNLTKKMIEETDTHKNDLYTLDRNRIEKICNFRRNPLEKVQELCRQIRNVMEDRINKSADGIVRQNKEFIRKITRVSEKTKHVLERNKNVREDIRKLNESLNIIDEMKNQVIQKQSTLTGKLYGELDQTKMTNNALNRNKEKVKATESMTKYLEKIHMELKLADVALNNAHENEDKLFTEVYDMSGRVNNQKQTFDQLADIIQIFSKSIHDMEEDACVDAQSRFDYCILRILNAARDLGHDNGLLPQPTKKYNQTKKI